MKAVWLPPYSMPRDTMLPSCCQTSAGQHKVPPLSTIFIRYPLRLSDQTLHVSQSSLNVPLCSWTVFKDTHGRGQMMPAAVHQTHQQQLTFAITTGNPPPSGMSICPSGPLKSFCFCGSKPTKCK